MAGLILAGCGPSSKSSHSSAEQHQELEQLRADNKVVKSLRAENQELTRLRAENQELQQLRGFDREMSRLRAENDEIRKALAALPTPPPAPALEPPMTNRLQPIEDLVRAFQDAAIVVSSQPAAKPEDLPQEGDNILIDQSVIGLLIPEFQERTNSGPYEISGWLASRGVVLTNYQQFNFLGITNYQIRRAPPKPQNPPAP